MVFCNNGHDTLFVDLIGVTILILVDGFLQFKLVSICITDTGVTILILVDGFLQ